MNFIFIMFYTSMLLFSYKVFSADLCQSSTFTEVTLLSGDVSKLDPFGYACRSGCPNGYKEISVVAIAESFTEGGNIVQSNMNRTGMIERLDLISMNIKELLKIYEGTENDEILVRVEVAIAELQSARSILLNSYGKRTEIVEYKDSSNELVLAEISRGNGIDNLDADERLKLSRSMYIGLQLFDEVSGMYKKEQNSKKSEIGDHPLDSF